MGRKVVLILVSIGVWFIFFAVNTTIFGKINNKVNTKLSAKDKLVIQDFQIAGLRLKQPIEEVIKILGKPTKVKTIPNGFNGCDEYDYYFPGVIVIISEFSKNVFELRIDNKDFKTYRGISVGDKEDNVYLHYGKTEKLGGEVLSYKLLVNNMERLYYSLDFQIKKGKVIKITIYSISED